MKNRNSKTPIPIWMRDVVIQYERVGKSKSGKTRKSKNTKASALQRISPRVVTAFVDAACSCGGENEKCYKCNGTGIYKKEVVDNIDECQDRLQVRQAFSANPKQESQFSNDQRGGSFGIREQGRFSSNPHFDEDC